METKIKPFTKNTYFGPPSMRPGSLQRLIRYGNSEEKEKAKIEMKKRKERSAKHAKIYYDNLMKKKREKEEQRINNLFNEYNSKGCGEKYPEPYDLMKYFTKDENLLKWARERDHQYDYERIYPKEEYNINYDDLIDYDHDDFYSDDEYFSE